MADFVFQSDEMAKNKSKKLSYLLEHVLVYTMVFTMTSLIYFFNNLEIFKVWKFIAITFIFHGLTDYITSKITSYYYKKEKRHDFFVTIRADQVLHYLQLIITYNLIWQN